MIRFNNIVTGAIMLLILIIFTPIAYIGEILEFIGNRIKFLMAEIVVILINLVNKQW